MKNGYADKKIVVVGAGRSGQALARYFCNRGAQVVLSDRRRREELGSLADLENKRLRFDLGGHDSSLLTAADLIVVSPGVPTDLPVLQQASNAGVEILGEVEIAWRELNAPLVGITGTNGKSTTTAVCGEMFRHAGLRTFVGGNLGTPLSEAVDAENWQWLVVELSSFQLETVKDFHPRYALLLNLSDDHLDRYADLQAYHEAKLRLFENQGRGDFAILNADDEAVRKLTGNLAAEKIWFSSQQSLAEGMCLENNQIVWRYEDNDLRFDISQLKLRGSHNLENVMAAMVAPLLEGLDPCLVWKAACEFGGLPHRMQLVRRLNDVDWINDSKGTNVGSVIKSLAGVEAPVTLIAGGKDKGGDFKDLQALVAAKVPRLLLIGEAAARIARELDGCASIEICSDLEDAVGRARKMTPAGGTVLLSPGCSSFDMFANYEKRGESFSALVNDLDVDEVQ